MLRSCGPMPALWCGWHGLERDQETQQERRAVRGMRAVEEDARRKSTRQLWRQLFEEVTEWFRGRGEELIYAKLDDQLTEFLREKYFEGKLRSYAVNVIRAVKFEVPAEMGRDSLGRARNAVARWDDTPFLELDTSKVRAAGLQAMGTAAVCNGLGEMLGLEPLLQLRGSSRSMPAAVDSALHRVFKGYFPHVSAEDWRGCKPLRQDLQNFLGQWMVLPGEEDREGGTFPDHPAMRLVIRHSPALFQLEMAGSAAFQMEGSLALLGHDLLRLNLDTVGLWFRPPGSTDVQLLQENNLNQSFGSGSATEIAALGQKLRRFLDPRQAIDAAQLLNPGTVSTLSMLFPDAKYDVALVQDTFQHYDLQAPYALEDTHFLEKIRGSPRDCYLSYTLESNGRICSCHHLLKTQEHLDATRVEFYEAQLREALATGSNARPSALVLDFFNGGQIHAPQADEGDEVRGPGGRRLQKRLRDAVEKGYMDHSVNKHRTWILLDGHHKVEAAVRLHCSLNFLVFAPCAEPYEPLSDGEFSPILAKAATFPHVWPSQSSPIAEWEVARRCSCVAMRLSSSRQLSEAWICRQGCSCFEVEDSGFPPWVYGMVRMMNSAGGNSPSSRSMLMERCRSRFGKESELFTTYRNANMAALPESLNLQLVEAAFDVAFLE